MKKVFFIIICLSVICTVGGCDYFQRENPNCPGTITEHGNFDLFPKSIALMEQYKGKKKAYFKDSLGNEEVFEIAYNDWEKPHSIIIPSGKDNGNCREDKFTERNIRIEYKHSNPLNTFSFLLSSKIDEATFTKKSEFATCFGFDVSKEGTILAGFEIPKIDAMLNEKTKNIFGKEYKYCSISGYEDLCYINYEQGLIAIRLVHLGHKMLVFDRME